MSTRAAVHLSHQRDPRIAGRAAAGAALAELNGPADLALVFATVGYAQQPMLDAVREVLGSHCVVAGCSGEGVIAYGEASEVDHAVGVMAVALDGARAEAHLVDDYARDPVGTAVALARRIGGYDDIIAVLIFPDGLGGDCSAFLNALRPRLPGVTFVGGAAGDAMTFERTFQYAEGTVRSSAVSAVVLRGRGEVRVEASHGCTPCGPHQTITSTDGSWVREIDGRPAWHVFREFLDGDPQDLNAEGIVHLCIGTAGDPASKVVADPMIIRTPLALDSATGALLFPGGGLSAGQRVRMSRRDAPRIRATSVASARRLVAGQANRRPAFVLQFDCAGRGKVMFGDRAAAETVNPMRAELGENVPWLGFHTYGEIAETETGLNYHNYTVALCAFYDS